jgi:hypothetical protein
MTPLSSIYVCMYVCIWRYEQIVESKHAICQAANGHHCNSYKVKVTAWNQLAPFIWYSISKASEIHVHRGSHRFHPATRTGFHEWTDVPRFNPAAQVIGVLSHRPATAYSFNCPPFPAGSRLSLHRQMLLTVFAWQLL